MTASAPAPPRAPVAPRRKPWLVVTVIVAVVLVLSGVAAYFVLFRPPEVRVVTYAVTSEMVTLDPSTEFSNSGLVLSNVYEALTKFDPVAQEPKPWLATSWQSSADGLTWTFSLRQGVKFHDGTPFNATAVKFSIDRTWRMQSGAFFIWFPVNWSHPTPVEVVSEYVVRFHLSYSAPMDWIASAGYGAWIFSPNTPGGSDAGMAEWFEAGHDSGSGPYTLVTEQYSKTRVVFQRSNDYWGGWRAGQFDFAVIRVINDPAQREAAVREGDVDITIDVPVQDLPQLQADPRLKVEIKPSYRTMYAFLNNGRAPTDNASFRRALAYAIPYDDIIASVVSGIGSQPVGIVPAGMWGHDDTLPKFEFNLAKAQQFLAQSPYPTGGVTLKLTYTQDDLFEQQFATLWKEKLAQLGITLNIFGLPWEQQWALAQAGPAGSPDVQDIFVMYWWPTYITPYDFLWNLFHSGSYAFFNLGYYDYPAFDGTIDEASALEASDRATALAKYREAQLMLYNDAAAVGIVDLKNFYVMKSDLRGFKDNAAYPLVVFFYELSR